MQKKKKIIILLIVISIVLLFTLIVILNKLKDQNEYAIDMSENISDIITTEKEIYFQDYKVIKNCLQIYSNTLNIDSSSYYGRNENNEYEKVVTDTDIKENIYNLISENYIKKNNITIENTYDYVDITTKNNIIIPIKIIDKTQGENTTNKYSVSALSISIDNKQEFSYLYLIINIDKQNNTFSIEPIKDEDTLKKAKINYEMNTIEKKHNNTFLDVKSTQEEIALDYFSNYKNILLSDLDLAYNYLDTQYKEKRFKNIEEFKKYANNNKEIFEKIRLEQYDVKYYEEYFQYICIDQFRNTYIFNVKDTTNYTTLLDVYTIDLTQFAEKYDSSNAQEKVGLNIQKVIAALNDKDYQYIYNKLYDEFKGNYYKNLQEFQDYMSKTFLTKVGVSFNDFFNEGETYIYNVTLKAATAGGQEINMQIIMQLKEERDFVMSFSIK